MCLIILLLVCLCVGFLGLNFVVVGAMSVCLVTLIMVASAYSVGFCSFGFSWCFVWVGVGWC